MQDALGQPNCHPGLDWIVQSEFKTVHLHQLTDPDIICISTLTLSAKYNVSPVHGLSTLLAGHKQQHWWRKTLSDELPQAQHFALLLPHKQQPLSHGGCGCIPGAHGQPEGVLQHIACQSLNAFWQSGAKQSPHL